MQSDETLLKSGEVAELLRVHPKQIYRLIRRGLPGHRVGGEWRFDRDQVLAWAGSVSIAGSTGGKAASSASGSSSPASAPLVPALLAANGDVVIEMLLGRVNSGGSAILGFVQADSGQGLELLAGGQVLAAGSHGGGPPPRLGAARLARIHLVTREVGLAWVRGRRTPTLRSLAKLRVATRPSSAGVMVHLNAALDAVGAGLGQQRALTSHREVVCSVLRGDSDVGVVTRAWADKVGLEFHTLATEPYGLAVLAERLGHPAATRLCEVAQSNELRQALFQVPGYDATGSGDIRYDPEAEGSAMPARPRRRAVRR